MKRTLRIALNFAFFTSLLFSSLNVQATHIMGADFTYECVGTCQYRVHMRVLRDCSGSQFISFNNAYFQPVGINPCGVPDTVAGQSWLPAWQITEITPVCPSVISNCSTGALRGIQEYYNRATYDFCNVTCPQKFTWGWCCRTIPITGMGENAYMDGTIIDPTVAPCNNSPVFTSPPSQYICSGTPSRLNLGAHDPDGDSLVYSLQACLQAPNQSATYSTAFTPTQPLGPTWSVTLDSRTGDIAFDPTPGNLQVGFICVQVEEFRNGVKVGQLWRDFQVTVYSCLTQNPTFDSLVVISNGVEAFGNQIVEVDTGSQLCFDLYTSDLNSGDTLTLWQDENIPGLVMYDAGTLLQSDTIRGTAPVARFCWTPTAYGTYTFMARVKDDACPFYSYADKYIMIEVGSGVRVDTSPLTCREYQFTANPFGGSPPYTFNWSGQGGINGNPNNTDSSFFHNFPGPGIFNFSVNVTDGAGFNKTYNGSVTVDTSDRAFLITNYRQLGCQPDSVLLDPGGGYLSYLWSTGATSSFIYADTAGEYSVQVENSPGCILTDTVNVSDSNSVSVGGACFSSTGMPLDSQRVYLVWFNPQDTSLTAVDTTYTDSVGRYQFNCPFTHSHYLIKAAPDSADYPNSMPTYYLNSLLALNAAPWSLNAPGFAYIFCVSGTNPGGPGFIGGLISQGANKQTDPVPNLDLFLVDSTNTRIAYAKSDGNGYFRFSNLPLGEYKIYADVALLDTSRAPVVEILSGALNQDSIPFVLQSHGLERQTITHLLESPRMDLTLSPNPFSHRLFLDFELEEAEEIQIRLTDVRGKEMGVLDLGRKAAGTHRIELDNWNRIPSGLYFAEVRMGGQREVIKVIKGHRQ